MNRPTGSARSASNAVKSRRPGAARVIPGLSTLLRPSAEGSSSSSTAETTDTATTSTADAREQGSDPPTPASSLIPPAAKRYLAIAAEAMRQQKPVRVTTAPTTTAAVRSSAEDLSVTPQQQSLETGVVRGGGSSRPAAPPPSAAVASTSAITTGLLAARSQNKASNSFNPTGYSAAGIASSVFAGVVSRLRQRFPQLFLRMDQWIQRSVAFVRSEYGSHLIARLVLTAGIGIGIVSVVVAVYQYRKAGRTAKKLQSYKHKYTSTLQSYSTDVSEWCKQEEQALELLLNVAEQCQPRCPPTTATTTTITATTTTATATTTSTGSNDEDRRLVRKKWTKLIQQLHKQLAIAQEGGELSTRAIITTYSTALNLLQDRIAALEENAQAATTTTTTSSTAASESSSSKDG